MELRVRQFVCWLVFLIIFGVALDCIIGEVDEEVVEVLEVERLAARPQVALTVPIGFEKPVDAGEQKVMSDVEFSAVVEKRSVEVRLDYVSEGLAILMFGSSQFALDGAESAQRDSIAAIGVFSRLYDPHSIWLILVFFHKMLEL